jgi:hypothetical protein
MAAEAECHRRVRFGNLSLGAKNSPRDMHTNDDPYVAMVDHMLSGHSQIGTTQQKRRDRGTMMRIVIDTAETIFRADETCLLTFGSIENGGFTAASDIDLIYVYIDRYSDDRLWILEREISKLGHNCYILPVLLVDRVSVSPPILFALATCRYLWGNISMATSLLLGFDLLLSELTSTELLMYWDGDPYRYPSHYEHTDLKMSHGGSLDYCFRRVLVRWAHSNSISLGLIGHTLVAANSFICTSLNAFRTKNPNFSENQADQRTLRRRICRMLLGVNAEVINHLFWHVARKGGSVTMSDLFKWLTRFGIEIIIFLTGFILLLLGAMKQLPSSSSSWTIRVAERPTIWMLAVGGILMIAGALVGIYDRKSAVPLHGADKPGSTMPAHTTRAQLADFSDLIHKKPSEPVTDLAREAEDQLIAQRDRIDKREAELRQARDHQLVQLVAEAHLDLNSSDYDQRINDRFLAVGATSKAVIKTLYKYSLDDEVSCDELYRQHNSKDLKHRVNSESEMYHRVMMLAFLSLVDLKAVGPRNTVVKKLPAVYRVLSKSRRLDS